MRCMGSDTTPTYMQGQLSTNDRVNCSDIAQEWVERLPQFELRKIDGVGLLKLHTNTEQKLEDVLSS